MAKGIDGRFVKTDLDTLLTALYVFVDDQVVRYWGVKLYLVTTAHGMPITWCLANPKLGERDVAIELLGQARDQHLLPFPHPHR
ncbi:hypothetical protein GCM10009765_33070 [Fodinicola feengrottensis]|uniref:Transposase n=1 Tax=Fodinicola feengrottensis TaxID=435914 RepID=A0ABP4T2P5_9ACTN